MLKEGLNSRATLKVLYCEDDHEIRKICFKKLSELLGAFVVQAESGEQALNLLGKGEIFDVIVCDYRMPLGNGIEVYKSLQGQIKDIPFILYTSNPESDFSQYVGNPNFYYVYKGTELCKPLISELSKIFKSSEKVKDG